MSLITLTSDLGTKDNYVALVKASILSLIEEVTIVDISHDIEKFSLTNAAYIFGNAYINFPKDTFHLVGIKSHQVAKRLLYAELKNQKIICLDNGFISLLKNYEQARIFSFDENEFKPWLFFLKDVMVKAFQTVQQNTNMLKPCNDFIQLMPFQPTVTPTSIIGRCLHIDDFGNVITNITKDFFEAERNGRKFTINLPGAEIDEIANNYDDVGLHTALAIFNGFGYLEIALNQERASKLLFPRNMHTNTDFGISIQFED